MRTGLLRRYGKKDTVQEYIDVVIKHFGLSNRVRDTALEMFNYVAQKTSFGGFAPSMLAMTLVNLAAKERHVQISSKKWSTISSYHTLLKHSRDLNKVLKKRDTEVSDTADFKKVVIPPNFTNSELENNYFIPRYVKVVKGQEIGWINLDDSNHHLNFYDVLHDEPKLLFDLIPETKKFTTRKFDFNLSRIDYRCTLHNNEIGTVVIYKTPEEEMTSKQQFEFLSEIFDIKPPPSLSHLRAR